MGHKETDGEMWRNGHSMDWKRQTCNHYVTGKALSLVYGLRILNESPV